MIEVKSGDKVFFATLSETENYVQGASYPVLRIEDSGDGTGRVIFSGKPIIEEFSQQGVLTKNGRLQISEFSASGLMGRGKTVIDTVLVVVTEENKEYLHDFAFRALPGMGK